MLGELQREITEEESKQAPSTQTKKDEAEPLLITEE